MAEFQLVLTPEEGDFLAALLKSALCDTRVEPHARTRPSISSGCSVRNACCVGS